MTHNLEIKANVSIEFSRTGDTQYELNKQVINKHNPICVYNDISDELTLMIIDYENPKYSYLETIPKFSKFYNMKLLFQVNDVFNVEDEKEPITSVIIKMN